MTAAIDRGALLHVTHRNNYAYETLVSSSYSQAHLVPRSVPRAGGNGDHHGGAFEQICKVTDLVIDPQPLDCRLRNDFFGNQVAYFSIQEPHVRLSVTATSTVEVFERPMPQGGPPWEMVRDALSADGDVGMIEARSFTLNSPRIKASSALADFARPAFRPGRSLADAVRDLATMIHRQFDYAPGLTTVNTSTEELLALGRGVCQDFAQFAVGCLRSLGLAARYVSGYLETRPLPGESKLVGSDRSHAWFDYFLPGVGWIGLDPTNNLFVSNSHVVTAWGRDYGDVPPIKGIVFTKNQDHQLHVSVDVLHLDDRS